MIHLQSESGDNDGQIQEIKTMVEDATNLKFLDCYSLYGSLHLVTRFVI